MTSTTLTPGAGNYYVSLNAKVTGGTTKDEGVIISIYLDGVQVSGTERGTFLKKGKIGHASTQALLTGVTAGEAIEGRWRTDLGLSSMDLGERSLVLIEVD